MQDLAARRFLFVLLIGSLLLVGAVFWPLAEALLMAAVLAMVLATLQRRLTASRACVREKRRTRAAVDNPQLAGIALINTPGTV